MTAEGFRELRLGCVTSQHDAARLLGVCVRTVRNWENRRRRVPYAAFRLLRLLRNGELHGDAWAGWRLWGDTLWTPEGVALKAREAAWWTLLLRQAQGFRTLIDDRCSLLAGSAMDGRLASRSDSPPAPLIAATEAVPVVRQPPPTLPDALRRPCAKVGGAERRRVGAQRLPAAGLVNTETSVLKSSRQMRVGVGSEAVNVG